jgi:hypothetical protein
MAGLVRLFLAIQAAAIADAVCVDGRVKPVDDGMKFGG